MASLVYAADRGSTPHDHNDSHSPWVVPATRRRGSEPSTPILHSEGSPSSTFEKRTRSPSGETRAPRAPFRGRRSRASPTLSHRYGRASAPRGRPRCRSRPGRRRDRSACLWEPPGRAAVERKYPVPHPQRGAVRHPPRVDVGGHGPPVRHRELRLASTVEPVDADRHREAVPHRDAGGIGRPRDAPPVRGEGGEHVAVVSLITTSPGYGASPPQSMKRRTARYLPSGDHIDPSAQYSPDQP